MTACEGPRVLRSGEDFSDRRRKVAGHTPAEDSSGTCQRSRGACTPPGWAKGDLRHGLQAIAARMHGWPIGDCETNVS